MTNQIDGPPAAPLPPEEGGDGQKKKKRKKDKVRSAWISFVGRIVAQVVGAVATIVLGLMFVQKYSGHAPPSGEPTQPAALPAATRTASSPGERALVVLPLDNFSADPGQEYFADGMTEALIADLAQIRGLRVISRTSAMQYKGKRKPLPEIARELNVDLVLEGSVVRDSQRLRLTAQLIDARSDEHIWARTYDRTIRDVLAVQADLATEIARAIKAAVGTSEASQAVPGPRDAAAYDLYLKGRQSFNAMRADALVRAAEHFNEATKLDPGFAEAYAGLSDTYALLGTLGFGNMAARDAMPLGRAAAERAVKLNPNLSDAHQALAFIQHLYDWDWAGAERGYRRALELNPNSASARQRYAVFLSSQGRYQEGLAQARRAIEIDPLAATVYRTLGFVHYHGRQYAASAVEHRRALEMDPDSVGGQLMLAWSLIEGGDASGAVQVCTRALSKGSNEQILVALAYAHARAGQMDRARAIRQDLLSRAPAASPGALARLHAGLRENDLALSALQRAVNERLDIVAWLPADPIFDALRSDPRFTAVLRRVGLPAGTQPAVRLGVKTHRRRIA